MLGLTDRTFRLNKENGILSGEDKAGSARPNYHMSGDAKVIIALARQLENDLSVSPPIKATAWDSLIH
jgi:hypothetical protein